MSRRFLCSQNRVCDKDRTPEAIREMERYCELHPNGPAALRRPTLSLRGNNYIVLLGESVGSGIVGFGATVFAALRAFDLQYRKTFRPAE
jgi:hypothetical protein